MQRIVGDFNKVPPVVFLFFFFARDNESDISVIGGVLTQFPLCSFLWCSALFRGYAEEHES